MFVYVHRTISFFLKNLAYDYRVQLKNMSGIKFYVK